MSQNQMRQLTPLLRAFPLPQVPVKLMNQIHPTKCGDMPEIEVFCYHKALKAIVCDVRHKGFCAVTVDTLLDNKSGATAVCEKVVDKLERGVSEAEMIRPFIRKPRVETTLAAEKDIATRN